MDKKFNESNEDLVDRRSKLSNRGMIDSRLKGILYLVGIFAFLFTNDTITLKSMLILKKIGGPYIAGSAGILDVLSAVVTIIVSLIVLRLFARDDGLKREKFGPKSIIVAIVVALGIGGLSNIWLDFAYTHLTNVPIISDELKYFSGSYNDNKSSGYIWTLLSLGIIGPISEELVFRGVVFRFAQKAWKAPHSPS